jgi:hypothetical protein
MKFKEALNHYINPTFKVYVKNAIEKKIVKKDVLGGRRFCNCRGEGSKNIGLCPVLSLYRFILDEKGEAYYDDDMCGDLESKFFIVFNRRYDSCTDTKDALESVLKAYCEEKKRIVRI